MGNSVRGFCPPLLLRPQLVRACYTSSLILFCEEAEEYGLANTDYFGFAFDSAGELSLKIFPYKSNCIHALQKSQRKHLTPKKGDKIMTGTLSMILSKESFLVFKRPSPP